MRIPKTAVFSTIVLAIGVSANAVLLTHVKQPIAVKNAAVKAIVQPVQKDTTQAAVTAPVASPEPIQAPVSVPAVNTADQNRAQLEAVITAKATTIITAIGLPNAQALIGIQWACVDRIVNATVGYDDYSAALDVDTAQFLLLQPDNATSYGYFQDQGTCRVIYAAVQP